MGRRAKYLTWGEKHEAERQRRIMYSQTARCRMLRQSQNERSYSKRKAAIAAASAVPESLHLPEVPDELYSLANFPLPRSVAFKDSLRSDEWYNDSDDYNDHVLSTFDKPPPYSTFPQGNIFQFQDILLGYRLRKRKEEEIARLERYRSDPLRDFSVEVHQEFMVCYSEWMQLNSEMKGTDPGVGKKLGMGLLEWKSQQVRHLEEDFNSLRQGFDAFLGLFVNRWHTLG